MRRHRHRAMVALRRLFSRPQWAIRLFDMADYQDQTGPGLVMIQIDGLSRQQMEKAMADGRLPNLQRLIEARRYELLDFYSGLPSSTPAVQGEIFYGQPTAVPAFGYRDRQSGEERGMLAGESARSVEEKLQQRAKGLLEHGSAYSNIYAAGSSESHYCAARMAASSPRRVMAWMFMAVLYLPTLIRAIALTIVELGLALVDMVRGVSEHQGLMQELRFIPARVAVCLLLREIITFGVRVDLARGLPVIHVNFLGYDEQSHRRGPDSRFAHWTLKGIDKAIGQIYRAARKSSSRPYQVWVYSDHGQEHTLPYARLTGRDIHQVVAAATSEVLAGQHHHAESERAPHHERASLTGWAWLDKLMPKPQEPLVHGEKPAQWIFTKGPVGHVYFPAPADDEQRREIARRLVRDQVPAVVARLSDGSHWACTADADGTWAQMLPQLVTADRRHADWVRQDLNRLVGHPDAGDLVLLAWRPGLEQPLSFPDENGAHGGYAPTEMYPFALLPRGVTDSLHGQDMRPATLRALALRHLGRENDVPPITADTPPLGGQAGRQVPETEAIVPYTRAPIVGLAGRDLRLVTWNVHSCGGVDGVIDPMRIANVLRGLHADVICLQEVDDCPSLPQLKGQLHMIADALGMEAVWHPICEWGERRYGLGILSRHDPQDIRLKRYDQHGRQEPRGLIYARFDWAGQPLHVLNTHWGLRAAERAAQAQMLLGDPGVGSLPRDEAQIVCGDLNCTRRGQAFRMLMGDLRDVWDDLPGGRPAATFPSLLPLRRIDHVLMNERLRADSILVPRGGQVRFASDHLPIVVDLHQMPKSAARPAAAPTAAPQPEPCDA